MVIRDGSSVLITYLVSSDDGRVLDQVLSDKPMRYVHGSGRLLGEVEAHLEGRSPGDVVSFRLEPPPQPSESHHHHHEDRGRLELPRDRLPEGFTPRVGAALVAEGPAGRSTLWVREVHPDHVVLDPTHPLSSIALNVQVQILEVEEAE